MDLYVIKALAHQNSAVNRRLYEGVQKVRGLAMKEMVAVFWDVDGCAARQFPGAWVHH